MFFFPYSAEYGQNSVSVRIMKHIGYSYSQNTRKATDEFYDLFFFLNKFFPGENTPLSWLRPSAAAEAANPCLRHGYYANWQKSN